MLVSCINFTVPSGPPADIKEYVVNSTSVHILWHPPVEDKRNGKIIFYTVAISGNESRVHLTHYNFTSNSTSVIVSYLRPFSEYNVSVAANTVIGKGPFTDPSVFHTPQDGN